METKFFVLKFERARIIGKPSAIYITNSLTLQVNNIKKVQETQSIVRLTSIKDTLRTEGLRWVLRRLRYRTPMTKLGRTVHRWARRTLSHLLFIPRRIQWFFTPVFPVRKDSLFAFYDLQVSPITYDVCWFAVAADHLRRKKGLDLIHFVIVPGKKNGLRDERTDYEAVIDSFERGWRLYNIILPVLTLVPSFAGITLLPSRDLASSILMAPGTKIYPDNYEPGFPVSHHPVDLLNSAKREKSEIGILRSSTQGLRYAQQWMAARLSERRLITITLRDCTFMPARNSNMEAWVTFAEHLDPKKYLPIFVLDTERTLDPLPKPLSGHEVVHEASWNVGFRMALYESSYLNLGVNNGPLFMCLLNSLTRVLIFKMLTPSVPQTTEEFMAKLGFDIGSQLPFTTPYQKLVWEEDSLETIEKEFFSMVDTIEKN